MLPLFDDRTAGWRTNLAKLVERDRSRSVNLEITGFRSVKLGYVVDKLAAAADRENMLVGLRRQGDVRIADEDGMAPVFHVPFGRSGVHVRFLASSCRLGA